MKKMRGVKILKFLIIMPVGFFGQTEKEKLTRIKINEAIIDYQNYHTYKAIGKAERALSLAKQTENRNLIADANVLLGSINLSISNYNKAIYYIKIGEKYCPKETKLFYTRTDL